MDDSDFLAESAEMVSADSAVEARRAAIKEMLMIPKWKRLLGVHHETEFHADFKFEVLLTNLRSAGMSDSLEFMFEMRKKMAAADPASEETNPPSAF